MNIYFNRLTAKYKKETIDIFNYYIEHTTAAYRSEKVDYDFFNALVDENVVSAYAVMNNSNDVIGFCILEKYKNIRTFDGIGDSCGGFHTPALGAATEGMESDCNHLMRTPIPALGAGIGDCMYFIKPEMTGKGVGREIVSLLENDAKLYGMKKLVVDISDENEKSIAFHKKHGFIEYGRLKNCWRKFARNIGIVYMYKDIGTAK